jgi:multicomponent Na+:H+ antiporter subunit A
VALVLLVIFLPFLGAALLPVFHAALTRRTALWACLPAAASLLVSLGFLPAIAQGETYLWAIDWFPSLGVRWLLALDGLSLLFVLLIAAFGLLVIGYSAYYLSPAERLVRFYAYLLLFMASMLGLVLSANLLALYVFWELTSISSYLLIGFWHTRPEARYGARKALLVTTLGGLALLGGIVLLYHVAGTVELPELAQRGDLIRASALYPAILVLMLIGACAKSAQFPFHIWLPDAMAAPTPVSAYLHSATMVKAGLYLICRMLPILGGTTAWMYAIASLGLVTMLLGAVLALRQIDLKALLAYSTISQLGLMMIFYAPATANGVRAATFHLLNHAAFKGALFLLVGIIEHQTGTRDRRALRGLMGRLPITGTLTGIAALAMAGVPPLNGFLSKEILYEVALEMTSLGEGMWLLPVLVVGGSILTMVYALSIFWGVFFGVPSKALANQVREPSIGMLLAPALLAATCIGVSVVLHQLDTFVLTPAVHSVTGQAGSKSLALWHGWVPATLMSILTLIVGIGLYLVTRSPSRWVPSRAARGAINALYDKGLDGVERLGMALTELLQSGYLKFSVMIIMGYLVLSFGSALLLNTGTLLGPLDLASIELFEAALILLLVVGAIAVPLARQPLMAVLALGLVGFLVSFLFVVLRAPDLALTQLLIETASLILFLLVLRHLPSFDRERLSRWAWWRDIAISTLVGGLVVVLLLIANTENLYPSIASYFLEYSLQLGGGRNVVNVIVVDFRGYDTMGEITVLTIAAIGVYSLIKLKREPRR